MACENLDQKLILDNPSSGAMMILRVMAESVMQAQNIGTTTKENPILKPSYPHSILSLINQKPESPTSNISQLPFTNTDKSLLPPANILQQIGQSVKMQNLTDCINPEPGIVNTEQIYVLNLSDLQFPITIDNGLIESSPDTNPVISDISKIDSNICITNNHSNQVLCPKVLQSNAVLRAESGNTLPVVNSSSLPSNSLFIVPSSPSSEVTNESPKPLSMTVEVNCLTTQNSEQSSHQRDLTYVTSSENSLRPYKCGMCDATFTRLGNFTRHKMIHTILLTEDTRHKCETCGRHFLRKCDLKRHLSIHEGTEPYRCNICSKGYIRNSDLLTHLRFHNKEKPFKCEECSKGFSQKGDMMRHVRSVHQLLDKPLTCGHCSKKFAKETTLIRHFQTDHKDIIMKSLSLLTNENKLNSTAADSSQKQ